LRPFREFHAVAKNAEGQVEPGCSLPMFTRLICVYFFEHRHSYDRNGERRELEVRAELTNAPVRCVSGAYIGALKLSRNVRFGVGWKWKSGIPGPPRAGLIAGFAASDGVAASCLVHEL
jgi:hypothetical protein